MAQAIAEARKSVYVSGAYCVGCVIVRDGKVISTGYSREIPGNTHAEECALLKLGNISDAERCTIYTTMEPCSIRLSGKRSCADRIIESGIRRVFQATAEPPDLVTCTGRESLRSIGIQVEVVARFELLALSIARGIPVADHPMSSFRI